MNSPVELNLRGSNLNRLRSIPQNHRVRQARQIHHPAREERRMHLRIQ